MENQILLEQQLLGLSGNHICLVYDKDPLEQLPALIPFIKQGLEKDEQVVYIADDLSVEQLSLILKMQRIDVEAESNRGALRLWTRKEWRQPGELDSQKKSEQVHGFIDDALKSGFKGIRFAVEMTWTLGPDIRAEELEHWEATINTIFTPGFPGKIICQYNRHRLPASVTNQALRTHPFAIIENCLCQNAFYEDPLILNDKSEDSRSKWMMSQLRTIHSEEKAELSRSLEEKNILLKEIHHRVRNNMQVISSLIRLQSANMEDDNKALKVFQECQNRIRSMALVHEALYRTNDFRRLNLDDYIKRLGNDLLRSYNLDPEKIKMEVDAIDVALDMDTGIACGLILNELITNSIKHAFPDDRNGKIKVNFFVVDKKAYLTVSDEGIGLPEGLDVDNCKTLGMRLVKTLINQLDGELEVENQHGTSFKIEFPAIKEA